MTLPFVEERLAEARALMGDDFWSYGVEPNRKVLDTFLPHHHAQGLSERRVSVEELFHPATYETFKLCHFSAPAVAANRREGACGLVACGNQVGDIRLPRGSGFRAFAPRLPRSRGRIDQIRSGNLMMKLSRFGIFTFGKRLRVHHVVLADRSC